MFGVSDGLVSNVGLILGVAGADPAPGVVRLAGLAGLVAGAISMAAGEYNSMKVQAELLERELRARAHASCAATPSTRPAELAEHLRGRGASTPDQARELAEAMMRDPDLALETHAREELGIDPDQLGSPLGGRGVVVRRASRSARWCRCSRGSSATGDGGHRGVARCSACVAAVVVGVAASAAPPSGRSPRAVVRQVLFTLVPAAHHLRHRLAPARASASADVSRDATSPT